MIRLGPLCGMCVLLAACDSIRPDQQSFDGEVFRSKATASDKEDRRKFTLEVRPVSASLDGARQAGRHEATKYCVQNYGNSVVVWDIGPDDDPASYVVQGDTLVFQGTCEG